MGIIKKQKSNTDIFKKHLSEKQAQEEYIFNTDPKTNFLPKPIHIDDLEIALTEEFENGKLSLVSNKNKKIPIIYMTNERWLEFSKTWDITNTDKNITYPYITIRRLNISEGTYLGVKYSVPNRKNFNYIQVPTFADGTYGYDIYRVPQPTAIDIDLEVKLFTKDILEGNKFYENLLHNFNGKQYYLNVNNHFIRVENESYENENTYQDLENERYLMYWQNLKIKGYLLDEKDFKIVNSYKKTNIGTFIENKLINRTIV